MRYKSVMQFSTTLDSLLTNLSKTGRSSKQAVGISIDAILVAFSLWAAYSLRYGIAFADLQSTWHVFLLLPICTILIFMSLGIYRWVVRSSNEKLFRQIIKASVVSACTLILITHLLPPDRTTPRSLFIIYGLVLFISSCSVRYLWRTLVVRSNRGEPIAIYGAGDAGRQLVNALTQGSEYRPVLFIDDDEKFSNRTVGGLPVVSGIKGDLLAHLHKADIQHVVLAMPSIEPEFYETTISAITEANIKVQTVPSYPELVSGTSSLSQVRDLSIADILGRPEVPPNPKLLGHRVCGQSVLITGGGGSIGSELCRQILKQNPACMVILCRRF